jgi:hypothetical protein
MTLRHDISQFHALKTAAEQLLGRQAWLDLKECTSLATWRAYVMKLLRAVRVSMEESIEICDSEWIEAVRENLNRGMDSTRSSKDIEELLSGFSATLIRQVFLQIGMLPNRATKDRVTLSGNNWCLNGHRSVQYVQTRSQIESAFWSAQQRRIGFRKQMDLHVAYRASKSKLPFSQWCRERRSARAGNPEGS